MNKLLKKSLAKELREQTEESEHQVALPSSEEEAKSAHQQAQQTAADLSP